jgi:hypothetical protein
MPLLCGECEGRFSTWERHFAEQIFKPVHAAEHTPLSLTYRGEWMLKFCVSVSWRVFTVVDRKGVDRLDAGAARWLQACR